MTDPDQHAFINRLRIMYSLDQKEIGLGDNNWVIFLNHPVYFLLRADRVTADAIWAAIRKREGNKPVATDLLTTLRTCAAAFRDYEMQHMNKEPPAFAKAATNRELAEACERVIRRVEEG